MVKGAETAIITAKESRDEEAIKSAEDQLEAAEETLKDLKANKKATERYIKGQKERIEQQKSQFEEDQESYGSIEKISTDQLKVFEKMQTGTDRHLKATIEGFSSLETILLGGFAAVVASNLGSAMLGKLARRWGSKGIPLAKGGLKDIVSKISKDTPKPRPPKPPKPVGKVTQKRIDITQKRADKTFKKAEKAELEGKTAKRDKLLDKAAKLERKAVDLKEGKGLFSSFKNFFKDQATEMAQEAGKDTIKREVSEKAGDAIPSRIDPPEPKGIFGKIADRYNSAKESVGKVFSGDGILGQVGKLFKPLSKLMKNILGGVGAAITAFTELPEIFTNLMKGEWVDALASMIPMATTAIGTIVGGALGPILGGFIYDKTGSYRPGWIMNTVFLLIISLLILALKPKST